MFTAGRFLLASFMTPKTALSVLGILPAAPSSLSLYPAPPSRMPLLTPAKVKKAYIAQTLRCHPDLFPEDPEANEKFKRLGEAFRVALQALDRRGKRRHVSSASGNDVSATEEEGAEESNRHSSAAEVMSNEAALQALRHAIWAYEAHQAHMESNDGAHPTEPPAPRSPFDTPSLEYIRQVCGQENTAKRQVETFCAALPSTLSGEGALFDAIAFFHSRHVGHTAKCVQRFAKHLPLLVSRVVRRRRTRGRLTGRGPAAKAAASGLGTGDRPAPQLKLEDMAMKPLVLMGALVFEAASEGNTVRRTTGDWGEEFQDEELFSSTYPGLVQPEEVKVTEELRCLIGTSDTIGDIVDKLSQWENESFERLQLELAVTYVCRLLTDLLRLNLEEDTMGVGKGKSQHMAATPSERQVSSGTSSVGRNSTAAKQDISGGKEMLSITMKPHLEYSHGALLQVLRMAQHMTRELLGLVDESLDPVFPPDKVWTQVIQEKTKKTETQASAKAQENSKMGHRKSKDPTSSTLSSVSSTGLHEYWWASESQSALQKVRSDPKDIRLAHLLAVCRSLSRLAAPHIRGKILLEWPEHLLQGGRSSDGESTAHRSTSQHRAPPETAPNASHETQQMASSHFRGGAEGNEPERKEVPFDYMATPTPYRVARHASCCVAEDVAFAVSFHMTQNVESFLLGWYEAMATVVYHEYQSRQHLPALLDLRGALIKDEFIPNSADMGSSSSVTSSEKKDSKRASKETVEGTTTRTPSHEEEKATSTTEKATMGSLPLKVSAELPPTSSVHREVQTKRSSIWETVEVKEKPCQSINAPSFSPLRTEFTHSTGLEPWEMEREQQWHTSSPRNGDRKGRKGVHHCSSQDPASRNMHEDHHINERNSEGEAGDEATYRYRRAIFTFPRIFNMNTREEAFFWRQVFHHREYVAKHTLVMNPINVYYNCAPYDPMGEVPLAAHEYVHSQAAAAHNAEQCGHHDDKNTSARASSQTTNPHASTSRSHSNSDTKGTSGCEFTASHGCDGSTASSPWQADCGWVSSSPLGSSREERDGNGGVDGSGDAAVLTTRTLRHPVGFREWLENVVEQSSLQREIQRVLVTAGVGYVQRDPELPLAAFLSFVQVFCAVSAVRGVLEADVPRSSAAASSVLSPQRTATEIGFTIVVSTFCDVRDGGRLYVPWTMDPQVLLALLGNDGSSEEGSVHSRLLSASGSV